MAIAKDRQQLQNYQKEVRRRLKKLMPIFARAAIGDFSKNIGIPKTEDEFTDLYVGLQIMLEVIREQKAELQAANKKLQQTLSERTEDLKEMATEQAKGEAILNSIGEGLVVTDQNYQVILANRAAAAILRCERQELVGQVWPRAVKVYDYRMKLLKRQQTAFVIAQQRKKPVSYHLEYFSRFDGTKVPVTVTASPMLIDGRVNGAVAVFRDITKELEVEQARQEFTALASHQLRTPVSIVKWYAQILAKRGANLTASQAKYIQEINAASDRMNGLIKSLLDIAKIETGKYLVEPAYFNVGEYIHDIVQGYTSQAAVKNIKITEKYPARPLNILTDPKVVRVAVENLLSNAIKFSKPSSQVEVTVLRQAANSQLDGRALQADSAVIAVKDHGAGILKEQQERVFKRMFIPSQRGGSGLGLYLTKAVVDRAGGQLWFSSRSGRGSSFYVSFPLNQQEV